MKVDFRRKNALNLLKEQEKFSNFDEFPVLKDSVDPQLHVSVNSVDQPFFLICEKDCTLAALTGKARVHFHDSSVRYFDLGPGDNVYVPAGTPHRITTQEAGLHVRYKARLAGLEATAWYCDVCDSEVDRYTWDTGVSLPQAGYLAGVLRFNDSGERRTCKACRHVHPAIDVSPYRWADVVETLA
jgi:3-hydroxyanthranilate 3,4-dioxygenase